MKFSEGKKQLLQSAKFRKIFYRHDLAYETSRMLIEARIDKGFTQEKLARAIGTTQSSIARAEQGKHPVGFDFLEKIAKAYKTYIIPPRFAFMKSIEALEMREDPSMRIISSDSIALHANQRKLKKGIKVAYNHP